MDGRRWMKATTTEYYHYQHFYRVEQLVYSNMCHPSSSLQRTIVRSHNDAGTKIWNISNFMIKHSSITSCTTFVLVVKYFQAQRFYPNISDFWNSTPAAPDTSLLQRWSMMRVAGSAVKRSIGFTITEKAPTRAFSWLKAPTSAFTFKTQLRHYAKRALTPRSLNVKLGPRHKGHKRRAVWLA